MRVLAIDIGSTTIKVALLHNHRLASVVLSAPTPATYHGDRAEIDAAQLLKRLTHLVAQLPADKRRADCIAHCCLCPGLVGLDRRGRPVTPIITHQDRRSIPQAQWLQTRLSQAQWLGIAGNLPFPGGISCTSILWLKENARDTFRRIHTFAHVSTLVGAFMTGKRVIDSSNASFTGLYETTTLAGFSAILCRTAGIDPRRLPEVRPAHAQAGTLTASAARRMRLPAGLPVLAGITDTSAAILAARAEVGQLSHSIGTTNVMAVVTDKPHPHAKRLTRALGTGRKWMSVCTLAAGAATFDWLHRNLFADRSSRRFHELLNQLAKDPIATQVRFEPYLAGDRMSITQRQARIAHLTLAATREQILQAALHAVARQTAQSLKRLRPFVDPERPVIVVGGAAPLARALHALWPGTWRFRTLRNATLVGLARLAEMQSDPAAPPVRPPLPRR